MNREQAIAYLRTQSAVYHAMRLFDDEGRVETIISMLTNATIWTPCTERMPTVEDGGKFGKVNVMYCDGSIDDCYPDEIDLNSIIAWSRIEPIGGGNG